MSIGLRHRIARITESIHVLVTGIGMKRANCRKCLGVERNEFLTWDTDNEGNVFFFVLFCFFVVVFLNCEFHYLNSFTHCHRQKV